jgi:hypothetical protein
MKTALVALALATTASAAFAGRACDDTPLSIGQIEKGMALAQATHQALEESGASVVVLARAGQELSEYGLRWSHLGLAYRDTSFGAPRWRVVHKLNACGTSTADLYRQGLGDFFLDRPARYEAIYAVLRPEVQRILLATLHSNRHAAALHSNRYNMLAYPWSGTYQQSNQWVTETLAAAAAPGQVFDRASAQTWLQKTGYEPTVLHLPTIKRLGARISMANIAFDDHPTSARMAGRISTTTADSVFAWASRIGVAGPAIYVPLGERSFFLRR